MGMCFFFFFYIRIPDRYNKKTAVPYKHVRRSTTSRKDHFRRFRYILFVFYVSDGVNIYNAGHSFNGERAWRYKKENKKKKTHSGHWNRGVYFEIYARGKDNKNIEKHAGIDLCISHVGMFPFITTLTSKSVSKYHICC